MKALEDSVRSISQDGLIWGRSTHIPLCTNPENKLGMGVDND